MMMRVPMSGRPVKAGAATNAPRSRMSMSVVALSSRKAINTETDVGNFRSASAAFLSALVVFSGVIAPASANIAGPTRVVDGDTLVINQERIRMYGLDAPESKQSCKDPSGRDYLCGVKSKEALEAKIAGRPVTCEVKSKDQYGRNVAECTSGGSNLNAWLVQSGNAVAYRQYGKEYIPLEEEAKSKKLGAPQVMTANTASNVTAAKVAKGTSAPQPIPAGTCPPGVAVIKGNINAKGTKIYHIPTSAQYDRVSDVAEGVAEAQHDRVRNVADSVAEVQYDRVRNVADSVAEVQYDRVKIEVEKGEKWFCSETEATKAGFRIAK
eukprot:gene4692-14894_t